MSNKAVLIYIFSVRQWEEYDIETDYMSVVVFLILFLKVLKFLKVF